MAAGAGFPTGQISSMEINNNKKRGERLRMVEGKEENRREDRIRKRKNKERIVRYRKWKRTQSRENMYGAKIELCTAYN